MFDTNHVPGDTYVRVDTLHVGDVIRMFTGLADTATVAAVTDHGPSQYGRHEYTLAFDDGASSRLDGMARVYLATGEPRTPLS